MKEGYQEVMGWHVPEATYPCWVISDAERKLSLKNKRPVADVSPPCYFKLTRQLDNDFVQGYLGHSSFNGEYHENISTNFTYLEHYLRRIPVYFTFDRVSLYKLITIHSSKPLTFILQRQDSPRITKDNTAFMIMPFRFPELNDFYQKNIKEVLKSELGIDIFRADDFSGNDIIIDTIYTQIEEAEFVVVDTSFDNKNAFYEFGYAAAKEKEIITIQNTDVEKTLFFDRAHIRAIFYSMSQTDVFRRQLLNFITAIRQKNHTPPSMTI
jgi:hypothetical protein